MTDILLRDDCDGIVTLTLHRPAARNALSIPLMQALDAQLQSIAADPAARVVIIAANGSAFCAGHDLREVRATPTREAYETLFTTCSVLMQRIVHLPKPVIAQVQGVATAAGCQLVASCDLAVAGEAARFATPGVDIGLFCSTPMVALSRAVGRKAAMEMLLTGDMVPPWRARELGLVNRVVADAELAEAARALAMQIAAKSPLTLAIGKEAFYRQLQMPQPLAYDYAQEVMSSNAADADAQEGMQAFLDKRPARWRG